MSGAAAVFTILASAIVVLGGLVTLIRAIWHVAQDLRDNKTATLANTKAIGELSVQMDGWLSVVERRLSQLEGGRRAR